MSLKAIATEACTLAVDTPTVNCTIVKTGVASLKGKAGGSGILKDGFSLSVSAITVPTAGATIPDTGPYTPSLAATATKTKLEGALVLRVDDMTATISATPKIPGSPPTPYPVSFKVKISDAGQAKVLGA